MEPFPIPADFILSKRNLPWGEVRWGYDNGWLRAQGVVDIALSHLASSKDGNVALLELASLSPRELREVPLFLEKLSQSCEDRYAPESRTDWLFIILAWLYEHRNEFRDPLELVAELWADFGYPDEIRSFVHYMPSERDYEPAAHTQDENMAALYKKWKKYLDASSSQRRLMPYEESFINRPGGRQE